MSGPGSRELMLVVDFVQAARSWHVGRSQRALVRLLPAPLGDAEVHLRVHRLVEVGAVLAGLLGRGAETGTGPGVQDERVRTVADELVALGAEGDVVGVELMVAEQCDAACADGADSLLADVLVELVTRFAGSGVSDRTPGALLPRRPTAAGDRPVPRELS